LADFIGDVPQSWHLPLIVGGDAADSLKYQAPKFLSAKQSSEPFWIKKCRPSSRLDAARMCHQYTEINLKLSIPAGEALKGALYWPHSRS